MQTLIDSKTFYERYGIDPSIFATSEVDITHTKSITDFLWTVADVLRFTVKKESYYKVMFPFLMLRRLECIMENNTGMSEIVSNYINELNSHDEKIRKLADADIKEDCGMMFYHTRSNRLNGMSELSDQDCIKQMTAYLEGYSENIQILFRKIKFKEQLHALNEAGKLYEVIKKFQSLDLSVERVSHQVISNALEDTMQKFSAGTNRDTGEHMTPEDIIYDIVLKVLLPDIPALRNGQNRTIHIYDPTCGFGGFLIKSAFIIKSIAQQYHPHCVIDFNFYGQELQPETWAYGCLMILMAGYDIKNIHNENTLENDMFKGMFFDYIFSNPPYGVKWGEKEGNIEAEYRDSIELDNPDAVYDEPYRKAKTSRFIDGLPPKNDGAMMFIQTVNNKLGKNKELAYNSDIGGRAGLVVASSPLTNGDPGSSLSNIRTQMFLNNRIEAIVKLPEFMFYDTSIATYELILDINGIKEQVILKDQSETYSPMRTPDGKKNRSIMDYYEQTYNDYGFVMLCGESNKTTKAIDSKLFGINRITIEYPLRGRFIITPEKIETLVNSDEFRLFPLEQQTRFIEAISECSIIDIREYNALIALLKPEKKKKKYETKEEKALADEEDSLKSSTYSLFQSNAYDLIFEPDDINLVKKGKQMVMDADKRDVEDLVSTEDLSVFRESIIEEDPEAIISPPVLGYSINFNQFFEEKEIEPSLQELLNSINDIDKDICELMSEIYE